MEIPLQEKVMCHIATCAILNRLTVREQLTFHTCEAVRKAVMLEKPCSSGRDDTVHASKIICLVVVARRVVKCMMLHREYARKYATWGEGRFKSLSESQRAF
jgi:hypothetical protein